MDFCSCDPRAPCRLCQVRESLVDPAVVGLLRAGVSPRDASALVDAARRDQRLVLTIIRKEGVREGDKVRVDKDRALEVIVIVPGDPGTYAVLGVAIDPLKAEGVIGL